MERLRKRTKTTEIFSISLLKFERSSNENYDIINIVNFRFNMSFISTFLWIFIYYNFGCNKQPKENT